MLRDLRQSAVLDLSVTRKNLAGGTVYDASKFKNNYPISGGMTVQASRWGMFGQRWLLNASTGYLNLGNSTSLKPPKISWIFAFNPSTLSSQRQLVMLPRGTPGTDGASYQLFLNTDGSVTWYARTTATGSVTATSPASTIAVGTDYLACGTSDGANLNLFVQSAGGLVSATTAFAKNLEYTGANNVYVGVSNNGSLASFFGGLIGLVACLPFAISALQFSSLYNYLLSGPQSSLGSPLTRPALRAAIRRRRRAGSAAGASASGAGGLIASGSLIASSLIAAVGGIVSTFNLVASSLYNAAAGIQAAAAEAVITNLTNGSAGISAASVEQVLSNLAGASAGMNTIAAQQVLTNLIAASGGIAGSQSLVASSIISVLANIQAVAEQSTAIAAQGLAGFAATGDVQVLNNLIALNEQLSAAASFVASSIYSAAASVDGPGSVAVLVNLLSVAERVQALAEQLANSLSAMQAGSGASATVIASSLYRASAGCGAFATVSAILDAAICELASIRPSYTAEAILRAMFKSAAGVRPSYAARADIDGC